MRYRIAIINFCIVLCYFLAYLALTWNTSGGDIFLIIIYLLSVFIHFIIIMSIFFQKKRKFNAGFKWNLYSSTYLLFSI